MHYRKPLPFLREETTYVNYIFKLNTASIGIVDPDENRPVNTGMTLIHYHPNIIVLLSVLSVRY